MYFQAWVSRTGVVFSFFLFMDVDRMSTNFLVHMTVPLDINPEYLGLFGKFAICIRTARITIYSVMIDLTSPFVSIYSEKPRSNTSFASVWCIIIFHETTDFVFFDTGKRSEHHRDCTNFKFSF
jgi:hypothetical protein